MSGRFLYNSSNSRILGFFLNLLSSLSHLSLINSFRSLSMNECGGKPRKKQAAGVATTGNAVSSASVVVKLHFPFHQHGHTFFFQGHKFDSIMHLDKQNDFRMNLKLNYSSIKSPSTQELPTLFPSNSWQPLLHWSRSSVFAMGMTLCCVREGAP